MLTGSVQGIGVTQQWTLTFLIPRACNDSFSKKAGGRTVIQDFLQK